MNASLLQGGKKSGKSCRPHSSTVGVKSWDMHWRMKNTGHRKAVQDRETANRGTEARGSKACEDGRRETNLLQTVFFIQSQISWKPDVIELVGKIDVLSSSLTFKLKKSDLSVLKWKNQRNSKNTLDNVKICHQSWKKTVNVLLEMKTLWCLTRLVRVYNPGQPPQLCTRCGHGPPCNLITWANLKLRPCCQGVGNQTQI